ncbi:MAG: anthranilate synthase component I, partial [Candidatus Omnitrophica bacterium]|nr:anthranilate synthase component I [Candidatus Omnitrophota bacterium]
MYYPDFKNFKRLAKKGNLIPITQEILTDLETPVSAFLKINRGGNSFLLESVEGGQRLARYSFIGTDPYRMLTTKGESKIDPLPLIAEELSKYRIVPTSGLPPFCGGAVGYLAYETVTRFEDLPSPDRDPLGLPESLFMFVDTMLVFDHVTHKIKVLSYVHLDGDIEEAYQKAVDRIDSLVERLGQPLSPTQHTKVATHHKSNYQLSSNFSKEQFEESVLKIKQYITA